LLKPVFVGSVGGSFENLAGFSGKPKTINRQEETYLEVSEGETPEFRHGIVCITSVM
jgi:hypothetical protein